MSFSTRVIQPSNFLTTAAVNLFRTEVKEVIESGAAIALVDLGNITSISSASFIAVVKILKLVQISNCQLFLCSTSEQMRMLFELTGLDQVLKTFADLDEFNRHMQTHGAVVGVPRNAKHNIEMVQRDSLKLAS